MEVRREHRGFMETMRAFLTTIRKRIGQRRSRQRTNNYRICRTLAMAKIESKKERRLKKAHGTKGKKSGNVTAEQKSTERKVQGEDGAPRGLRERMLSALQAFREGRKPRWVCRRGWRNNMGGFNMEDTRAGEDLQGTQAREDIQTQAIENVQTQRCPEIPTVADIQTHSGEDPQTQASPGICARENIQTDADEDIQTRNRQNGQNPKTHASLEIPTKEDIQTQASQDHQTRDGDDIQAQDGENPHETEASPEIDAGVDIQTQAEEVLQTQASEDILTEAGENLQDTQTSPNTQAQEHLPPAEPASWLVGYGQMWQKIAQHQKLAPNDYVLYREDFHDTQAMEDVQAEPASWVVAYGQMWQNITQQDRPVPCIEGCHDTKARESLDDVLAREGLEALEPASWFVANAHMWGNTCTQKGVDIF